MREWLAIKQKIERTPAIASVNVESMSPRFALLALHYRGDLPALQTALRQAGLAFTAPHALWSETAGQAGQQIHQLRSIAPTAGTLQ